MAPSFLFDFTDKSPNVTVTDILQNIPSLSVPPEEKKNLCPYPIPKLDNIVKDIEHSAYQVDKHKFVSDLFECGAIAISNQADLAQKEKREEKRNVKSGICRSSMVIRPTCKGNLQRFSESSMPCSRPLYTITAGSTTTSASCL